MGLISSIFGKKNDWIENLIEWGIKYSIKNFPNNKKDLIDIEKIDFSHWTYAFKEYEKVYELPNEICNLKNLKVLYLGSKYNNDQIQCELSKIPNCICELYNLEELYLSNQYELKKLPKCIGKLKNLKKLIMFNIDIEIPEEIVNLKKLNELYLPVYFEPTPKQKKWIDKLKESGCKIDDDSNDGEYDPLDDIISELNEVNGQLENENINEEYNDTDDPIYAESEDILDEYGIEYIYHMTHYKNIESILENGLLSHYNDLASENIDNTEVNDRRDKLEPINQKNIHNYVPFYFNPKNPMLYANKEIQEDIVILAFSRKLLLKDKTIYTDGNAASDSTGFYYYLEDLDKLNWQCINSTYWSDFEDGKREIMAEVLVNKKVKIKHLKKIYCYDEATKEYILNLDSDINVKVKKNLYF